LLVCGTGTLWMWDVLDRFELWLATCRVRGCGLCRLVKKLWPRGADCITLSLANCSCEGATIESPAGGGLLRRDIMPGVLAVKGTGALSRGSSASTIADLWSRCRIKSRC